MELEDGEGLYMLRKNIATLSTTDWNEEWRCLQELRRKPGDPDYWSKRSKSFDAQSGRSPYVDDFLRLADLRPGETILDMGCGTGSLTGPLAARGHKVIAADFSQGMLDETAARIRRKKLEGIELKLMSWSDDWSSQGVVPGSTDVCFASRSIATSDLRNSLMRLDSVARRRVCITMPTGSSARQDLSILRTCGIEEAFGHEYQYAFNILVNEGILPRINYIFSERKDTYDTFDEACADFGKMIDDVLESSETTRIRTAKEKLRAWLSANLIENGDAGRMGARGKIEKKFCLRQSRTIVWAFISWNK